MACNKCRQSAPRDGDTWCLACSSWEALGQELTSRWSCSSSRRLADDLVLSVTRQVRFLRNLSAGIRANAEAAASRGERPAAAGKRAREDQEDKPALQRRREASQLRPLELSAKKRSDRVEKTENSDTEDKFEEDTEEEEVVEDTHRPLGGSGDRKPPEPKGPPPSRRPPVANTSGARDKQRSAGGDKRHHKADRGGHHYKPRHRAGRKHQRIGRLEEDPELPIHRKLSGALVDNLASELERDFRDLHQ